MASIQEKVEQLNKRAASEKSVYLLHYITYNWERHTLLSTLKNIDKNL